MDVSQPFMSQVGGRCWFELFFCTQRKSTDLIQKTPTTDWLTDLPLSSAFDFYWSLCLICSCPELPMLMQLSLLHSRLGWDWNHHRPVKPHIRLEAVWCFCQKSGSPQEYFAAFTPAWFGFGLMEAMCKQMTLKGSHRINSHGVIMSWTKDGTISNVVALTE